MAIGCALPTLPTLPFLPLHSAKASASSSTWQSRDRGSCFCDALRTFKTGRRSTKGTFIQGRHARNGTEEPRLGHRLRVNCVCSIGCDALAAIDRGAQSLASSSLSERSCKLA
ncbi:hypothetical protein EDD21DRAFT_351360 [Dissophora ornata]|nr:hypothetical protein EDD21DRAFT_351360 [Dissophora ornata]